MAEAGIGVIQKRTGNEWAAPRTVAALGDFTTALVERYAAQTLIASCVDLALAWEPPAQVNYYQDGARIEIASAVRIDREHLISSPARSTGYGEREASALFERLFSRHLRVATFAPLTPTDTPMVKPASPFAQEVSEAARSASVERALPRTTPVEPIAPSSPAPAFDSQDAGWGTRPTMPAEPKPTLLPAPEIRRVADQVMHEIDRRVSATRERLGRR